MYASSRDLMPKEADIQMPQVGFLIIFDLNANPMQNSSSLGVKMVHMVCIMFQDQSHLSIVLEEKWLRLIRSALVMRLLGHLFQRWH